MANITLNENPQLNLEMEAMTVNTEGHCDEWNRRHKQLLENDRYLSEEQKKNNEPEFTVAKKRENIASKEKMPKILGKIAKFFTDLKTVAFSGKYSDLDGKPAIVNNNTTTEAGSALDARQANPNIDGTLAKQISDLNSDLNDINGSLNRYPSKLSQCYATDNESHTFPIDALSLFFITYGNNDQADVYLCRCVSVNAHALVPLHTSSVIAQTYEIKLDVATRSVTITSKRSWAQVDVINI